MVPMDEDEYAQSKRYVAYDSLEIHYRKADGTHRVSWSFTPFASDRDTGGRIWMELHPEHAAEVMAGREVNFWEAFRKSPRPVEVSVAMRKGPRPPDVFRWEWHPNVTIYYSEAAWVEAHPDWFSEIAMIPMDDDGEDWS